MSDTPGSANLWPTFGGVTVKAPVAILREQANLLGQRTQNLVVGQVVTGTTKDGAPHAMFFLVASSVNYRVRLFTMFSSMETLYPVRIASAFLAEPEKEKKKTAKVWLPKDEETLLAALREIFNDEKTIKVVQALMAQSAAEPAQDDMPF